MYHLVTKRIIASTHIDFTVLKSLFLLVRKYTFLQKKLTNQSETPALIKKNNKS